MFNINLAIDWIWALDLWSQKRPFYQLSHHPLPMILAFVHLSRGLRLRWRNLMKRKRRLICQQRCLQSPTHHSSWRRRPGSTLAEPPWCMLHSPWPAHHHFKCSEAPSSSLSASWVSSSSRGSWSGSAGSEWVSSFVALSLLACRTFCRFKKSLRLCLICTSALIWQFFI